MTESGTLIERMCLVAKEKEALLSSVAHLMAHLDEQIDPMVQRAVVDQVRAVKGEIQRLDQVFLAAHAQLLESENVQTLAELNQELLLPLRGVQDAILNMADYEKVIKTHEEPFRRIENAITAQEKTIHRQDKAAKAYKNLSKK